MIKLTHAALRLATALMVSTSIALSASGASHAATNCFRGINLSGAVGNDNLGVIQAPGIASATPHYYPAGTALVWCVSRFSERADLAAEFAVSPSTVYAIAAGKRWSHLQGASA